MKPESADASENISGDGTARICETGQFDEELQPIYRQHPSYPLVAQFYGIEGFIELVIEVGPEGRITSHEVINAEPGGLFEGVAVEALEQWKYCPLGDGETETRETKIRLRFDLEN